MSVWESEPILVQIWTWSRSVCWLGRLSPPHLWGDGAGLLLRKRRPKIQVDYSISSYFTWTVLIFFDAPFTSDTALQRAHGDQAPTPPPGPDGPTCCQGPGWPWGRRSSTRAGRAERPEQQRPTRPSAGTPLSDTDVTTAVWTCDLKAELRLGGGFGKLARDFVTISFVFAKSFYGIQSLLSPIYFSVFILIQVI